MEFKVNFKSRFQLFFFKNEHLGTESVKILRKTLNVNVPVNLIESLVKGDYSNSLTIDVDSEFAFKHDVFKETCFPEVYVTGDKAFNKFKDKSITVVRDLETDAIEQIYFTHCLKEDEILKAWEEAGFPLEWDLSEEITTKTP